MVMVKQFVREGLYKLGLFSLFHRVRNARTLTVFMFHRVLPPDSEEYTRAEREFTLSVENFSRCLDFIGEHYNVVSHAQIQRYVNEGEPLPVRAGLITFDDGWRDTLIHAAPELRKRSLPAVLFLATEVMTLDENRWWQDMLVEALSKPDQLGAIEAAAELADDPEGARAERVKRITCSFAKMDDQRRHSILRAYVGSECANRQMLAEDEVARLKPDIAIAGHGHTHAPLGHHEDPMVELETCRRRLVEIGADDWAMSFPHGDCDSNALTRAHAAGFRLCYTSEPVLVGTESNGGKPFRFGRIHVPENAWTCERGAISESKLSTFLFMRPVAT
jgi:peptidoglycan/xylan/chitin deacetylase (PgdA/CDA1 family)